MQGKTNDTDDRRPETRYFDDTEIFFPAGFLGDMQNPSGFLYKPFQPVR